MEVMSDENKTEGARGGVARTITYRMGPTARRFHACTAGVKGVMGPIGSGKSVMCCEEIYMKSCRQKVDPETNERVSRWMIVRNTFAQLQKTTLRTWMQWFPGTKVHMSSPMSGVYRCPHPSGDGTTVVIELEFRALDGEDQIADLLSLEVTGCWFNEARELEFNLIQNAKSRLDRYPASKPWLNYYPIQDLGVIMDTNPGSEEGWWYQKAEIEKPDGWAFFRQPPGVLRIDDGEGRHHFEANRGQDPAIPPAENCENYSSGFDYYTKKLSGASEDWIRVYLQGEYGTTNEGKAVYPDYSDTVHYFDGELTPAWGLPLYMGTDFGRTPATVIGQLMPDGQFVVYDELCGQDMGIIEFCQGFLRPLLANKYRLSQMRAFNFADPAGSAGNQIDNISCIEMMNQQGIPTQPCSVPNNSPYLRWASVTEALRCRLSNGKPGLVICRPCKKLRAGFLGKYCYRRLNKSGFGGETYAAAVDKDNPYSHPHDALQYMVYGATHQSGESAFDVGVRRVAGYVAPGGALVPPASYVAASPAMARPLNAPTPLVPFGGRYSRFSAVGAATGRLRMDGFC